LLGIAITPLLAGAGLFGFAVAYASKDVLGNFLSGMFLLVDRPIKIGDRIMIERIGSQWGSWGDVVDVGLRTTTVKNTDGINVTYPNAKLAESVIKNFTPNDDIPVRFRVRLLLDLDNDLDHALKIAQQIAVDEPTILDAPAPTAIIRSMFSETGGHMHRGALIELRSFVSDIRVRTRLRSKVLLALHRAYREEGVLMANFSIKAPRQTE
jgi:small-conductance mechanosensitive channel